MKVVVVGGTGLVGSKLVMVLIRRGQEVLSVSPHAGVDTLTGRGLAGALAGAHAVIDVTNSPSFEDAAVMAFFETSSRNLLAAEAGAGVRHHVVLSVVGTDRLQGSGYFRAKLVQERLVKTSGIPFTILRATQFFEFMSGIADHAGDGNTVRLPPVTVQPILADDVATALADVALGTPVNDTIELAGPETFRLDDLVRRVLGTSNDARVVIADANARYFGAELDDESLMPASNSRFAPTHFGTWLAGTAQRVASGQSEGPSAQQGERI